MRLCGSNKLYILVAEQKQLTREMNYDVKPEPCVLTSIAARSRHK